MFKISCLDIFCLFSGGSYTDQLAFPIILFETKTQKNTHTHYDEIKKKAHDSQIFQDKVKLIGPS